MAWSQFPQSLFTNIGSRVYQFIICSCSYSAWCFLPLGNVIMAAQGRLSPHGPFEWRCMRHVNAVTFPQLWLCNIFLCLFFVTRGPDLTEVKPEEPESLNQQSGLAEAVQEGASLGKNATSAEDAAKEESRTAPPPEDTKPEVENNSKFTGTNTTVMIIPATNVLLCSWRSFRHFLTLFEFRLLSIFGGKVSFKAPWLCGWGRCRLFRLKAR